MNVPSDHESSRRYGFNLPWRGVVTGAVFYAGLSVFTIHLAKDFAGIMFVVLITLSAIFVLLAIIMVARRLVFPRVLELSEDAVLFPHGFPRTRITPIRYADVIQMSWTHTGLEMVTPRGHFEITASHFKEKEGYRAAADFVCRKTAIAMPPQREPEMFDRRRRAFPEPLLNWDEPRELSAYRTRLVVSSPLVPRLAKALWFFVRCLGFFILPWLLLQLFQLPTISTGGFLCVAIPVALFFTLLHWLSATYPTRYTKISVFDRGITQLSGKQTRSLSYRDCSGWNVVERQFEGQILRILLLQCRAYVVEVALPDTSTRDRLVQLFHDKQIPQSLDLKPSWESRLAPKSKNLRLG